MQVTKRAITALFTIIIASGLAFAIPLMPTINGFDFNIGAENIDGVAEYQTNGLLPDTLTYTRSVNQHPGEVTALWPNWPLRPAVPVLDDLTPSAFGGDFVLNVKFDNQDAPYVNPGNGDLLDVSLTGVGVLKIYGTVTLMQTVMTGLLWELELPKVALYGRSATNPNRLKPESMVLEGLGRITGGEVADAFHLIGQVGALRGHVDFRDPLNYPAPVSWFPAEYHPLRNEMPNMRATFSGETGWTAVPEPSTIVIIGISAASLVALRKKKI